jgi:hypothetical protein
MGNAISKTTCELDLGVLFDARLSFELHIAGKIKKAIRFLVQLDDASCIWMRLLW